MSSNKQHKSLVLFTLQYPYGKAETFLESEIRFLSKSFDTIYVVPSTNESTTPLRSTPGNVRIIDSLANCAVQYSLIQVTPYLFMFFRTWLFCFWRTKKKKNYIRYFKSLLHHYYNEISKKRVIEEILTQTHQVNILCYDYWLSNSSIALIELKKKGKIRKLVCRAHRFDLYDEANREGIVPFREFKVAGIDSIYTISKHGYNYLLAHTPSMYHNKINLRYLGVDGPNKVPEKQHISIVVSCSNLLPIKQVNKIAESLREIKEPFKWIHFGDGPHYEYVKKITETFPEHIQVELKGFVANKDVLKFYENNYITCFISLSSSEGLPVSMMEAQSFGIPIVAPPIYGIPEIVNCQTGYLLPKNYSLKEVSRVVEDIISQKLSFDRNFIQEYFYKHFDASKNYQQFAYNLLSLND